MTNPLERTARSLLQELPNRLMIESVPNGVLVRATHGVMSPGDWNALRKAMRAEAPNVLIASGAGYGWARLTFTLPEAEAICAKCDRPFDVTEEYVETCDRCDDDWGQ